MVFVDYEEAISNSMEGDHTLYDAIRHYVGTAEEKGWTLYLETNSGIILDFRLAMIDNLFKLRDIINNEKYKVDGQIEYTHELKVVDGVARIVEIEDEDPGDPDDPYIISITSVPNIEVDIGTSEEEAISKLRKTTTIKDSEGDTHIVSLDWSIRNYDKDLEGEYIAIGVFELPEGIKIDWA